jgi:hypothetical protein
VNEESSRGVRSSRFLESLRRAAEPPWRSSREESNVHTRKHILDTLKQRNRTACILVTAKQDLRSRPPPAIPLPLFSKQLLDALEDRVL